MIILHNQHDKDSRDFVEKYGEGNEIIDYPKCVELYPNISAFPSVVIEVPAYHVPAQTIHALDEQGNQIMDDEGNPVPPFELSAKNIEGQVEIFRFIDDPCDPDLFWTDIQDYIELITERAQNNPPK
jgi:hypothetical protein